MKHTTSFWFENNTVQIVRVLYLSYASWDKTLMADVNLNTGTITFYDGNDEIARSGIADFQTISSVDEHNCGYRLLGRGNKFSECDISIVLEALNIVKQYVADNYDDKLGHDLKLHMESAFYPYFYFDGKNLSAGELKDLLVNLFITRETGQNNARSQYYCGITNDLDTRMEKHRNEDFQIVDECVTAYVCATVPIAKEVEHLMDIDGFSIEVKQGENSDRYAGNGAVEDSVIVYLLKKGDYVRRN